LKTRLFTAGILMSRGRLLIMKRKPGDDTYPGLWDCVGGHFEEGESAEGCMLREASEESGLRVKVVKTGRLIEYRDRYGRSVAVPFLLEASRGRVTVSEHEEFRWVYPGEARRLRTVPALKMALDDFGL
jgi:8-oxo-dGTP diphosphatase